MRNKLKLQEELRNKGISHSIFELKGECIGIAHDGSRKGQVADIVELLGYSFLLPHEYEYSYKEKPLGQTIVF